MASRPRHPVFPRPIRRIGAQTLWLLYYKVTDRAIFGDNVRFGMSVFSNRRDGPRGSRRLPDGPDQMPDRLRKVVRPTAWHEGGALAPLRVGWHHRELIL